MNILIAPDKFKGSLTARQVCETIREGIAGRFHGHSFTLVPLADGGEGTVELLTRLHHGYPIHVDVRGPLFRCTKATYGISRDGQHAFIEMAQASGLSLIPPHERNPLLTTTAGTGDLIRDALNRGVRHIVLGMGGSATNDAGIGMASALGFSFLDSERAVLVPVGGNLIKLHSIDKEKIHPALGETTFTALCDVTNPLYGPSGAACVYGPQKGADAEAVQRLDEGLRTVERVVKKTLQVSLDFPGAGAAGGLGAGMKAFLNAEIRNGMEYVLEATQLGPSISAADVVITGEGKIDEQTLSGKVVHAVSQLARHHHKKVIAVCGHCTLPEEALQRAGIDQVIALVDQDTSPEYAMEHARDLLFKRMVLLKL